VHVYLDNYFTSTRLTLALREYHIGLTGVCKLSATRVRESEAAKKYNLGYVMHIGFWDQKCICMQSTVFDAYKYEALRWRRA
jgi:hypothetical protein